MSIKIVFDVDDVGPKVGYGLLIDSDPTKYLKKLHDEFGCKFTLFTVPVWNGQENYDLRKNKIWVNKMKELGYFEFAAHGLTHTPIKKEYGGQEFAELPLEEIYKRIASSKIIFEEVGLDVVGFKSPGWNQPKEIYDILHSLKFKYIGDHFIGNVPIKQKIWRVPYTFSIDRMYHTDFKDGDVIILHSHISREFNIQNGWNEELYQVVRRYLLAIQAKGIPVEYVFMRDLV